MESSPRFHHADSYNEDNNNSIYPSSNHNSSSSTTSLANPIKLRLMCSNGGHIVPRPHDKSLCYVGGETRMVVIDRHTTLLDLTRRLTKTLIRSSSSLTAKSTATTSFTLKYQLPLEDLDSLISVTTDEDLENMIEEYERLNSSSSRIRLFMFPTDPEAVSSIGSFLENSSKSEDWFRNALNGSNSGFSDTSSVNCLLGLDDEISEKKDVNQKSAVNNSIQDVHSIPDSPMMETTSSFGSASSLANLPPIRVKADDHLKVVGGGGLEEQFSQMSVQQRHHKNHDDGGLVASPALVAVSGSPMSSATVIREQSDPSLSYHERSEQGLQMAYLKHQQQQQFQQNQSIGLSNCSITDQSPRNNNRAADPNDTPDQNTRIQMLQQQQQIQNSAYLLSTQHPQSHNQQLQFIHSAAPPLQYIHHNHPSGAVSVASYYQTYQHHPQHPQLDQQNLVYYMPSRQQQQQQPPQGYNFPLQQGQTSHSDAPPAATTIPINQAAANSGGPQFVRVPSGHQYGGYSGNYGYEFGDSLPQGQNVYYSNATQAAQFQNLTSVSPVEPNSPQQQVRTAQP